MRVYTAYPIEIEPGVSVLDAPNSAVFKIPAGAWVMETSGGSQAGYSPTARLRTFTSSEGIESIEAGLPVDDDLTKAQLQDIAAQLGLSTGGLKAEILERILLHLGA